MLSSNNRKGAFGEVEQIKNSKLQIKKDHQLIGISVGVLVVGIIIFLFFGQISTLHLFYSPLSYFGDSADGLMGKAFEEKQKFLESYLSFLVFMIVALYITASLVLGGLYKLNKVENKTFKQKALYNLFVPTNFLFSLINSWLQIPRDLRPKIGFENAWLEKLDRDFFHQIVEKQDGYKRASELTIFYDMPYILGYEAYPSFHRLFKSSESLEDLLKIIEGYLQKSNLYDELWINENDLEEYPSEDTPAHKIYDNFNAYMLRYDTRDKMYKDNVVFSRNALKIFIQKHTRFFYFFLDKKLFDLKNIGVKDDVNYFVQLDNLKSDISFNKKLEKYFGSEKNSKFHFAFTNSIELMKDENARDILFELLATDFMVVTFKTVIERFMGLPAGMLVSKIEDYDTRMIIETYKLRSLVKIVPTKNDGSTAQYNSDNYVNLFLMALYAYFDDENNGFFAELQDKFNTDIYEVPKKEVFADSGAQDVR